MVELPDGVSSERTLESLPQYGVAPLRDFELWGAAASMRAPETMAMDVGLALGVAAVSAWLLA